MGSLFLSRLSVDERNELISTLLENQHGNCFICGDSIDRDLHRGNIDIDHIQPMSVGGKDGLENFAATHHSCNRSKQATDLRVARVLSKFDQFSKQLQVDDESPNLGNVLDEHGGGKFEIVTSMENGHLRFSYSEIGLNQIESVPVFSDILSGFCSSFLNVPIEYLHHDDRINPRPIGRNLKKLVEEFHKKLPQLHVALGWIEAGESSKIRVFDGQHKAAAQILLGAKQLPVRVFLDPNTDKLLTANTHAGTTLRQVAFDKSVQRSLGSSLLTDRMRRYREERSLPEDYEDFSEQDLVNHFTGESREMRRYVLDWVRNSVTTHKENKLRDYIEYGGRKTNMPFSYSAVEKTFYSFFICPEMLDTSFNHLLEEGENPRITEIEQLVHLMNIIAEKIYVGKFDHTRGTKRIEYDIQQGKDVADEHLRAFRMAKEEVLHTWLRYVHQLVQQYFIMSGKPLNEKKIFQYQIPDECWMNVEKFVDSLSHMSFWINHDLSLSAFGGRHNYDYWQSIFETGKAPDHSKILPEGINLMHMIKD